MSPPPAEVLSLDLDGTLYRVQRFRVAWRLRHERGLLLALAAAREKIRHEGFFESQAALHAREVELVAPSFGLSIEETGARLDALRAVFPEVLTKGMRPYSGVRGALEAAHARGLKLAILSDYEAEEKLKYLGLEDLPWETWVSAEACGALKPHRAPFERLAEQVGVPLETVVHIGDREDVDVAGALAAGMRAWRFSPMRRILSDAERVFHRWPLDLFQALWSERS